MHRAVRIAVPANHRQAWACPTAAVAGVHYPVMDTNLPPDIPAPGGRRNAPAPKPSPVWRRDCAFCAWSHGRGGSAGGDARSLLRGCRSPRCWRLLAGLEREGLVERDPVTRQGLLRRRAEHPRRPGGPPAPAWRPGPSRCCPGSSPRRNQTACLSVKSGLDAVCVAPVRRHVGPCGRVSLDCRGTPAARRRGPARWRCWRACRPRSPRRSSPSTPTGWQATGSRRRRSAGWPSGPGCAGWRSTRGCSCPGSAASAWRLWTARAARPRRSGISFVSDRTPARDRTQFETVLAEAVKRLARHATPAARGR